MRASGSETLTTTDWMGLPMPLLGRNGLKNSMTPAMFGKHFFFFSPSPPLRCARQSQLLRSLSTRGNGFKCITFYIHTHPNYKHSSCGAAWDNTFAGLKRPMSSISVLAATTLTHPKFVFLISSFDRLSRTRFCIKPWDSFEEMDMY